MDSQVQLPSSCPSLKLFVILFVDSPSSIKPHFTAVIISILLVAGFFSLSFIFCVQQANVREVYKSLVGDDGAQIIWDFSKR